MVAQHLRPRAVWACELTKSPADASNYMTTPTVEPTYRTPYGVDFRDDTADEGGWRRSAVRVIAPPTALKGIVELFWIDEWSAAETSGRQFRVVADDAPHVLWHVSRDGARRVQRLTVVGSRAWHHDVDLSGRHLLIGARLRPGALPLLTHLPASRFTNRSQYRQSKSLTRWRHDRSRIAPVCPDAAVDQLATLILRYRGRRPQPSTHAPHGSARWIATGERAWRSWSARCECLHERFAPGASRISAWDSND